METESTALPRFRTDLVAQPIDEEGQRFVDVTDPDSGATFRFYDVEYSIACAMDGKRDLGGLVDYALEELGLEASPEELETVIGTLDELGYLELVGAENEELARVSRKVEDEQTDVDLAEGFELGAAGGTPEAADDAAAAEAMEGEELELGAPGRSPIAQPRPEVPKAPEVELGAAGTAASAEVEAPAAVRAITADLPQDEDAGGDEMSFAGLLDEDEAPTSVRVSPADLPADAAQVGAEAGEDAPTTVRGGAPARAAVGMGDFEEEEGLTPPPAEEPVPTLTPRGPSDSDYDGPTNLPPPQVPDYDDDDVSVDLSQHLSIDAEDVKEAVRASKVMDAVSVPEELLAEMDAAEGGAKPEPAAEVGEEKKAEPEEKAAKPKEEKKPKPVELPEKPVKVAAKKKAATAKEPPEAAVREKAAEERRGVSPVLLVLFVIALVGGAAAYYFLVYKEQRDARPGGKPATSKKAGPGRATGGAAVQPPTSVVISGKLEAAQPAAETVIASQDSVYAWLVDDGAAVAEGDRVAKLRDFDRWERKLREYKAREEHYQRKLEAANEKLEQAKAAGNEVDAKRYENDVVKNQAKVDEKKQLFDEAREALQKAELKAPVAGTAEVVVRVGALVKAGAPVIKIAQAPSLGVTFTLPAGKSAEAYTADEEVVLVGKDNPDSTLTCTVAAAEGDQVTVSCPTDGPLAGGDEVVLK